MVPPLILAASQAFLICSYGFFFFFFWDVLMLIVSCEMGIFFFCFFFLFGDVLILVVSLYEDCDFSLV